MIRLRLQSRPRPSSRSSSIESPANIIRNRTPILIVLLVNLLIVSHLTAQEPWVRASLDTKEETIWVGQRLTLAVELYAPGVFASAPIFDLPDPPGLLLMAPVGSPVLRNETVSGVAYTVQRHELSVFSQRPGRQTIPSLTVRFQFKRNFLDHDSVPASVTTEPVPFTAQLPKGAEKLGSVISTRNLTATENWAPAPEKAKIGGAFTRTITYAAPDTPGMAFPPFPVGKIDGMAIYTKAPEVLDESNRGSLSGKRRDTITYVCQRVGRFAIPAARLTWFDLDSQQLRTIEFPARVVTVAPNPAMAGASSPNEIVANKNWGRIAMIVLGILLGVGLLLIFFWKTRIFWLGVMRAFRLVHLAPLNPGDGGRLG